jgi:DNA primase
MKGNRAEVLRDLAKTQYPQSNTYNLPNNSIKSKDDFGFRNEATKDEIKRRVKLSSLLSSYGVRNIKQSSGNGQMICSCPFHADKKPSFSFNDDRSVYNCFSCGAQGDVFALVERMDNTNFKNAFNKLSAMAGINNNISGNTMKNKSNVAIQSPNQNTYIDYNNQEDQKIKAARSALQEMIKSSSNSYQELQNHPYSQKKHLELNVHNGQLSIGNY